MNNGDLLGKLRNYLEAEPRIEHGPPGLDERVHDRARLDNARAEASHAIAAASEHAPDAQADLLDAGERFLCAEAALRGCEADCVPRLERLSRELARDREALEAEMASKR